MTNADRPIHQKEIPASTLGPPSEPLGFLDDLVREHGDVCSYQNPYGRVVFFNHPDLVQETLSSPNLQRNSLFAMVTGQGLLSSEGSLWRTQRRLMQPFFHERCIGGFGPVITKTTLGMLERWKDGGFDRKPLDLAVEMRRLALEIAVRTLFTAEMENETLAWDEALTTLFGDMSAISATQFNLPLRFSASRNAELKRAMLTLDTHVYRLIAERRVQREKPRDLLTLLLEARQEETAEPLDDRLVRDEMVSMLIAGHETTSVVLTWAFYELSRHPEIEERLIAEVDRELQGRTPAVEDLARLPSLRMMLEETMRVHPPVWFTTRRALVADEIGGYRIPEKTVVLLSAYTTHKHPDFWPEPDCFDPGRFSPEAARGRHRYAYFPFAGGKHQCIGQGMAMLTAHLALALLLQRSRIHVVEGHPVEPWPEITLRVRHGLMVNVQERSGIWQR